MRYTRISLALGCLSLLASCSDDPVVKRDPSQYAGTEVHFGVSADDVKGSRTFYDYENHKATDTSYTLKWASDDRIVVASPMGQVGYNNKVYDINVANPGSADAVAATTITPNSGSNINTPPGVGIQWGTAPSKDATGTFYAIYPYRAETRRRPASLAGMTIYHNTIDLETKTATVLVEPNQRIWRNPYSAEEKLHNSSADYTPGLLQMYGSNHSNVMWAQTDNVEYGAEEVDLRFKPLSTSLMLTFQNPQGTTAGDVDAMIEDIKIIAPKDITIAGEMKIHFPSTGAPEGDEQGPNATDLLTSPATSFSLVEGSKFNSNQIEIWPWIRSDEFESGIHPILRPGDSMQVCAFMLPTVTGDITPEWTVQVTINNKVYKCSLVKTAKAIAPGQIHEIVLPPFDNLTEWKYNAASWMDDIDDNVYLSQITFPGAWYSYAKNSGDSNETYQNWTIAQQLENGARAFDLSTKSSWSGFDYNVLNKNNYKTFAGIKISGTGSNTGQTYNSGGSVNGSVYYNGTDVGTAVQTIVDYIATNASTEVGIIVLSYETGGTGGLRPIDFQAWMFGLQKMYDALPATTRANIYSGTITSETTLGEVRGKTILKINLGEEVCSYWGTNSAYPYPKTVTVDGKETKEYIPALLSFSPTRWVTDNMYIYDPTAKDEEGNPMPPTPMKTDEVYTFSSLTSALKWKEWDIAYNNTIINGVPADRPGIWAWNFSCTNRTRGGNTDDGYNVATTDLKYIPNLGTRKKALNMLLEEAKKVYIEGFHDEMFLFGCGGTLVESFDASTGSTNATQFADSMNVKWLNPTIKSLFTNNTPCPLGIVFFNQVGNATYEGQEILTNLIKMNDAFYLQRKPTASETRSVQSVAKDHSSGFTTSSDSWTAF